MAKYQIKTQITINADVAKVWEVLTDFDTYDEWNPFLKYIQGDVQVGKTVAICAGEMKFNPEILSRAENEHLSWKGVLWFSGLFDGTHVFRLEAKNNQTIFYHEEAFEGLLVGVFKKKLEQDTKQGFIAMNEALKARVEAA